MPKSSPLAALGRAYVQEKATSFYKPKRKVAAGGGDRPELLEQLPDWARPLLEPRRYKCLWGGRGGGKSYAVADSLLILGMKSRIRVLCAREFQVSIKESVHYILAERIETLKLSEFYSVQRDRITGTNGTEFIFKGVRHNVHSIKSMGGLTHLWIEEGQTISQESWRILVPTIREEGSEIWVTFNPDQEQDTVYQELVVKNRENAYVAKVNWDDNPYFPSVLNDERLDMLRTDPEAYHHIWEGGFWTRSNAQILKDKWCVEDFEASGQWEGPYLGADFGFSQDPTALIKCWIYDRRLWIEYESYAHRLELDDTAERWKRDVPGCDRHTIRGDSSRPDSISYLTRNGIPRIVSVKKWANSVEDGIAHLRSYDKIVIHPRCKHTMEECRLYRYKVDPHTDEPTRNIVDANNHAIDALRYSLAPIIQASRRGSMTASRARFG